MKPGIVIPTPCHENWDKMSPQEKGRHCGVCDKVVQDLTQKKSEEILAMIYQSQGNMCGRINVSQLAEKPVPKNKIYKAIPWLASLLPLFAFMTKAKAQGQVREETMGKVAYIAPQQEETHLVKFMIHATEDKQKIAGVNVTIYNSGEVLLASGMTNSAGEVVLTVKGRQENLHVGFAGIGYNDKHIYGLNLNKRDTTIRVSMDPFTDHFIMGLMVYIPEDTVDVKPVDSAFVSDKLPYDLPADSDVVIPAKTDYHILVYPVPANENITIEVPDELKNITEGKLFDANGELVKQFVVVANRYTTSVRELPAGEYVVTFYQAGEAIESKKIIVNH